MCSRDANPQDGPKSCSRSAYGPTTYDELHRRWGGGADVSKKLRDCARSFWPDLLQTAANLRRLPHFFRVVDAEFLAPPLMPFYNFNRRIDRTLACTICGLIFPWIAADPAPGQFREDFEQSSPSWTLGETDCAIATATWLQTRTSEESHSGKSSEYFRLQTGHGSKILVVHPIPPARLIDELRPSLWVKSKRSDVHLMIRVVLPRATAPDGSGPIKVMLDGGRYTSVGHWQQLDFDSESGGLQSQFQQQLWMLRTKFGARIDADEAYADMLVLNLYNGPGAVDVWVDDLAIDGLVDASAQAASAAQQALTDSDARVQPASAQEAVDPNNVRFDGNILEVGGQPFCARVIQHNGEPFELLQRLGFNVIELRGPADEAQLQSAAQLGLWLICPPPPHVGLQPIGSDYDRVLAWSLGRHLDGRDVENVRQMIREIRQSDTRRVRPVFADVRANWSEFGALAAIVSTGVDCLGGSFPLLRYSDWLAERQLLVGRNVPLWATVPTELHSDVQLQVAALVDRVPPAPFDPNQLEAVLVEAVAGGARGLRFLSRARLDATDPLTQLRAQTLRWLNARINQLEPWMAGGVVLGTIPVALPDLQVTAVQTDKARLLLIQRTTAWEQWVAGDRPFQRVAFNDTGASSTDKSYWLATSGMVPLPVSNAYGGASIEIDRCPAHAWVVVTESPVVINRLGGTYRMADGLTFARLREDIVRNWLAVTQLLDREMGRSARSGPVVGGAINEAVTLIQNGETMNQRGNLASADEFFAAADQRLALARREFLQAAREPFTSSGASPLLAHPLLVPSHWDLAAKLGRGNWQPNALAGGDFENLQLMVAHDWLNRRSHAPDIETKVELVAEAAVGGALGLKLSAARRTGSNAPVESAPVWITSGPIAVTSGQVVRIHGWAQLNGDLQGSSEGLMVIDSLGGLALAERITRSGQWQEFSLYRGVPADGKLTVTFALSGLGSAMIDEVTVRIADIVPPAAASNPLPLR